MKQTTKYAIAYIAGAFMAGTAIFGIMHKETSKLEKELALRSDANVKFLTHQRDYYRRQLIKHENPEGWTLNGDSMGSAWYERWEDFGTGVAKECLPYK